jgi:hypothetical protein
MAPIAFAGAKIGIIFYTTNLLGEKFLRKLSQTSLLFLQ